MSPNQALSRLAPNVYNVPTSELPPSIPTLPQNTPKTNVQGNEATATLKQADSISSSLVNMPPLPSLFESSNSINAFNDTKRKMSGTVLSSVSLFAAGNNDSTTDFFADGTLEAEEEEFVNAMLD